MAGGRGGGPSRQLGERHGDGILEIVGKRAEARPEHDPHVRYERGSRSNGSLEGVQPGGLLRRRDGTRGIASHVFSRGRRGHGCGPPEHSPGVDGRNGPRDFCEPDESTDTGMPVTSRRASQGRRRNAVATGYRSARSDLPWLKVLDVISVPRSLAAPSGKTYLTNSSHLWSTTLSTSFASSPVAVSTSYAPMWTGRGQGPPDRTAAHRTAVILRARTSRSSEGVPLPPHANRNTGRLVRPTARRRALRARRRSRRREGGRGGRDQSR